MDADMFEGLQHVLARMDTSPSLRLVVFESANPEFYLAHFELKDTTRTLGLLKTVGPSGLPSRIRQPVTSRQRVGRLRGRTRAPNCHLRSPPHCGSEESHQRRLTAVSRPAPRRPHVVHDGADVA